MEYITSEGIIVTNRIFVGSIPDWMCENKLHLAFQDLNFNVQDTRIVVDMRTGRKKGYGFVTFYDANDAVELVKKGFVLTKDGVKLKVDTAVRKKGLQLRLQREKKFFENTMNQYNVNNATTGLYPTEAIQTQMPYVYPAHVVCECTSCQARTSYQSTECASHAIMTRSYHPTYQDYTWQSQVTGIMPYTNF